MSSIIPSIARSNFTGNDTEWIFLKETAAYVITAGDDETICGNSFEIYDAIATASTKAPYGDVHYADEGYQKDGKKRYPIDNPSHIRSAWSYINQEKNHKGYTSEQVSSIKSKIVSAWKAKIDKSGPPSA